MKPKKNAEFQIPLNTSKYLRLTQSQIDIKQLLREDIEDNFVRNDANRIRYYDLHYNLRPIDGDYEYLEDVPFNSMHKLSEGKVKKRIMKILQKPQRNDLETLVLNNIEKKQGKLLSEINYEFNQEIHNSSSKLMPKSQEMNNNLPPLNKKKIVMETIVGYKNENEEKTVENLDQWVSDKIKKGNKKRKKEDKILRMARNLEPNTPLLSNRRNSIRSITNGHGMAAVVAAVVSNKKSQFSGKEDSDDPNMTNSANSTGRNTSKDAYEMESPAINAPKDPVVNVKYGKRMLAYAGSGLMPRSVTKISLHKNKKLNNTTGGPDGREGFVALPNFENLEEMLNNEKGEQNLLKVLSNAGDARAGVTHIIREMMEMRANEESSVIQSAIFYEKQNRVIENKLMKIIREHETTINNKQASIRMLRIENAKISKKMGYITKYLNYQPQRSEKRDSTERRGIMGGLSSFILQRAEDPLMSQEQKEMRDSLKLFKKRFEANNKEIVKLEEEAQLKKKELKSVLNSKKKFLLETLEKGHDVRDLGLVWIIKTLWSDAVNVTPDDLPPFLDSRSKAYLFNRARMEIDLSELQTLRKTIIEIYRASTNGEETNDTQNFFDPMFHIEEFDRKIAEKKSPNSITLMNASMRSTNNLFLPSLNTSAMNFSVQHSGNPGSQMLTTNYESFGNLNMTSNLRNSRTLVPSNTSLMVPDSFQANRTQTLNFGQSHNNQQFDEDEESNAQDDPMGETKKSKFHNIHRKLRITTGGFPGMAKKEAIKEYKKPTGMSEFLNMQINGGDDDEENEQNDNQSSNTQPSHSSDQSLTNENNSEDPSIHTPQNEYTQAEEAFMMQQKHEADLVNSLYHPMPEYPHDKNNFTKNEKMYKLTKDSIYNLIKNMENKEQIDFSEEDINQEKFEHRLKIFEGSILLNDYETRGQFIEKVENIQKQIEALENRMRQEEEMEADRTIKEFKLKDYKKRFNIDITVAIPAIFGAHKGERILIKNDLIRNSVKKNKSTSVSTKKI